MPVDRLAASQKVQTPNESDDVGGGKFIAPAIALGIGGFFFARYKLKQQRAVRRRELIEDSVRTHLSALRRRKLQLVRVDDYGVVHDGPWQKEIKEFSTNVFLPRLFSDDRFLFEHISPPLLVLAIMLEIERQIDLNPTTQAFQFVPGMDPIAYEHYCCEQLSRAGWSAQVTKAVGDQGVDVIATWQGHRLVAQCKLYTGTIDNGAVQEVISGRLFHEANHAIVVGSARFSPSAMQLAAKSDVALVHHEELEAYGRQLLARLQMSN